MQRVNFNCLMLTSNAKGPDVVLVLQQSLRQQRRWEEVQGVLGARAKSRVTSIE